MANYGGGIFLPSETAYKDPNRFRDILQAEGNKQAQYLAQMDQFFAQLDENKRQFDVNFAATEKRFTTDMAWKSDESSLDRELKRLELSIGERLGEGKLDLEKKQLDIFSGTQSLGMRTSIQKDQELAIKKDQELAMTKENNEFLKSFYLSEEARRQEKHTAILNASGAGAGIRGVSSFSRPYAGVDFSGGANKTDYNEYDNWNM